MWYIWTFNSQMIVMTPKSLLRHPDAKSDLDDMLGDTRFQRLIPEEGPAVENPNKVRNLAGV